MLYKRDYRTLTELEQKQLEKAESYLAKYRVNGLTTFQLFKYHELLPQPAYNFKSYFPNNYIHSGYDTSNLTLDKGLIDFRDLLERDDVDERAVLNFINTNEYYFILDSIFYKYNFGHHDAYLFKEFELPPNYIVDYLLVGKNSSGYEFVFIDQLHLK